MPQPRESDPLDATLVWRASLIRAENRVAAEVSQAFAKSLDLRALHALHDNMPLEQMENVLGDVAGAIDTALVAAVNAYRNEAVALVTQAWEVYDALMRDAFGGGEVREEVGPAAGGAPPEPAPPIGGIATVTMGGGLDPAKAVALVSKPYKGMDFRSRIRTLSSTQAARMRQMVASGLANGQNGITIARRAKRELVNLATWELVRIARTEVQHALTQMQEDWFEENADLIQGYTYLATLDERVCAICAESDGRFYRKGAARPELPRHPQCRCTYAPVPKAWGRNRYPAERHAYAPPDGGGRRSRWRTVPGKTTAREWLKTQPKHVLTAVFGSEKRAQLFLANPKMSLAKIGTAPAATVARLLLRKGG